MTSAAPAAPSGATSAYPSAELDPLLNGLIETARERESHRLRTRDSWTAAVLTTAFFAASGALAAFVPSHRSVHPATALGLIAAYAIYSRARFEVGSGLVLPTQLILVPMLFLLPLGSVPLFVCAAMLLGSSGELLSRRRTYDRLLLVPLNSWHALGPVAVLALAGEGPPTLHQWPLYLGALAAQFGTDFAIQAPREKFVNGVALRSAVRFMTTGFAVDAALAPIGLLVALVATHNAIAIAFVLPLLVLLRIFAHERQVRIDHALELSNAYRGTALLLGDVVEADDAYTGSHSRDVVSLVLGVCDRLGLDAGERRDAEFAALLHDIGKIKIPGEIINKAGPLTDEERQVINTHTVEGEQLLSQVGGILGNVGRIVRSCHEDWDGTGYPDGLADEAIPLVARIVRCCDAFSAITTDRPYRQGRPVAEAILELRRCAGTDFDPQVVEALVATVAAPG